MTANARRRQGGQATVEFALVAIFLLVLLFAILDFGIFIAGRIAATNAARSAARYAATHPTAWSNASNPSADSIQGKLVSASVPARIVNDDAHVTISYVVPGVGAGVTCGHYSADGNRFVAASGYSQSTCVVPGNLIRVRAVYNYTFATPIAGLVGLSQNVLTEDGEAAELEEA